MMRRTFAGFLFTSGLALAADFTVGSRIGDITLKDNDNSVVLSPSKAAATAVIFVSTTCPVSNAYNDRMSRLYSDYKGKGVQFAFVNSNVDESSADIDEHTKANKLSYKALKDPGNVLADRFGAQMTPEVFLFDRSGVLQYHGFVDDAKNEQRVHVQGARKALDALLAGKTPELKETKAFGCTIKRVRKTT